MYKSSLDVSWLALVSYPRTDACHACDEITTKAKALKAEGNTVELNQLGILNNLNKKKS